MKTLSLSEAKMKLSGLVEAVLSTDEEVVITKNGRPAAVMVSPDEFEGWRETNAIRSDSELMEEIKKGLTALNRHGRPAGKKRASLYTLEELFK
ncbi:MAG: type II toxin-antitoxin system Phd/YefM family antitoxin [Deltaproteobacteria bacterium]|nr:type II toxin-antitoxin system Phd/YefM family antitoxin [Deltaproteobacteria bacterium]